MLFHNLQKVQSLLQEKHLYHFYETCYKQLFIKEKQHSKNEASNNATFSNLLNNFLPSAPLQFNAPSSKSKAHHGEASFSKLVQHTIPWRKGPFWYGNFKVDSEWLSDAKWQTILNSVKHCIKTFFFSNSKGANTSRLAKTFNVLDVGSNNGYFLFQIALLLNTLLNKKDAENNKNKEAFNSYGTKHGTNIYGTNIANGGGNLPEQTLLVGLDPTWRYLQQFALLKKIYDAKNMPKNNSYIKSHLTMHNLPLGFQHLHFFKSEFNLVLAMGIVYHHKNPLEVISQIYNVVKKRGTAIFECIAAGNQETNAQCFFPKQTYLNKKGFWFMPGAKALVAMLSRSGFKCTFLETKWLTPAEQRKSAHAPYASLSEGILNGGLANSTTIEGYPLPTRNYVIATKS